MGRQHFYEKMRIWELCQKTHIMSIPVSHFSNCWDICHSEWNLQIWNSYFRCKRFLDISIGWVYKVYVFLNFLVNHRLGFTALRNSLKISNFFCNVLSKMSISLARIDRFSKSWMRCKVRTTEIWIVEKLNIAVLYHLLQCHQNRQLWWHSYHEEPAFS